MENSKNFLLEVAEQNKEIVYESNKTLAKLSWLKLWDKNPKIAEEKDIQLLAKRIEELGVYKPLIVYLEKDNATILGGNQRYKALKLLAEKNPGKYIYAWVSVVNADNDTDKIKYALSDNEQVGKYTREKLRAILGVEQRSLFDGFNINFSDDQSVDKFINELSISDEELKIQQVSKDLKVMGLNDEAIEIVKEMTGCNKLTEKMDDIDMQGAIVGIRQPLIFWFEDETLWEQLNEIYKTSQKHKANKDLFVKITEKHFDIKLPTDQAKILNILEQAKQAKQDISSFKELDGSTESITNKQQELNTLKVEIRKLYINIFKETI